MSAPATGPASRPTLATTSGAMSGVAPRSETCESAAVCRSDDHEGEHREAEAELDGLAHSAGSVRTCTNSSSRTLAYGRTWTVPSSSSTRVMRPIGMSGGKRDG